MTTPQPTIRTHGTITHVYDFEPSDDRTVVHFGEQVAVTSLTIRRDHDGHARTSWEGVARRLNGTWGRARRTGTTWFGQFPEWMRPLIDAVPTPVVTWEGQDR